MSKIATVLVYDLTASGQMQQHQVSEPDKPYVAHRDPHLDLFTSSVFDENGFCPSQHIHVQGVEGVTKLRDFCNQLLNDPTPK